MTRRASMGCNHLTRDEWTVLFWGINSRDTTSYCGFGPRKKAESALSLRNFSAHWGIPYSLRVEMEKVRRVMKPCFTRSHVLDTNNEWRERIPIERLYFLLLPALPTSTSCNVCGCILQALFPGLWRPKCTVHSYVCWLGHRRVENGYYEQSTSWSSQNLWYYPEEGEDSLLLASVNFSSHLSLQLHDPIKIKPVETLTDRLPSSISDSSVVLKEPTDAVSDFFPRYPAKGHLHIIVLRGKWQIIVSSFE